MLSRSQASQIEFDPARAAEQQPSGAFPAIGSAAGAGKSQRVGNAALFGCRAAIAKGREDG